jgi:ABC-type branched-subunit amino acid transport system substrate-binding protein
LRGRVPFQSMQRRGALGVASALGLAALALGWQLASACSALVDRADSQCARDEDCAKFGAFTCVRGGCTAAPELEAGTDAATFGPCTTTAECLTAHGGAGWVCRHLDNTCVSVISPDCPTILGHYERDDAILLGAIVPIDGPHATTGAALSNALRLAVEDFGPGIPGPDGGARPLAVVLCNESTLVDRAATHLAEDLLVPAIVGTGESATTRQVAADVTRPKGLLLISARATADLSSVSSSGLVWRTCPSDTYEADALVALAEKVVLPNVTADASASAHVALVHATDVESIELDAKISGTLHLNGALATDPSNAPYFVHVDYGDPDSLADTDASGAFSAAVDAVVTAPTPPDVVLLVGSTQAVSNVLAALEGRWPLGVSPPRYIVSSGLQTSELLTLAAAKDSLRRRILGTAPGGNGANVDAFYGRFARAFLDGTVAQEFGVAQAYDALYVLAFAEAASPKSAPLGAELRDALVGALTPRPPLASVPIDVAPASIPATFAALADGEPIAVNGASAPLPFQTTSGDVVTDVQVWCIAPASDAGAIAYERSGIAFVSNSATLAGNAVGANCGQ